jgi:hypothetical protein
MARMIRVNFPLWFYLLWVMSIGAMGFVLGRLF